MSEIPTPENMSTVRITTKGECSFHGKVLEGLVVRTQTGMKFVGEGKERKKVPDRLVSVRDSDGTEHTLDLDQEVESLEVVKERKDALAEKEVPEDPGEVVPPEAGESGA